jgi:probable DNA metabolism protein
MIRQDAAVDFSFLPENARRLYELSVDAFDAVVHSWMSELPVINETIRFGRKIFAAADNAVASMAVSVADGASACQRPDSRRELIETAERQAAEQAATDRGDPDVLAVRAAAYKVWHEINRLMGLLRFCPDENGVYIARCEPDHFILPALGPHFRGRFGETPWAVIDEKRRLCLRRAGGGLELIGVNEDLSTEKPQNGEWENLWRNYHKAINNESRNNPDLQLRFMPKRYWKYLTEV